MPLRAKTTCRCKTNTASPACSGTCLTLNVHKDKTYKYEFAVLGTGSIRLFIRQFGHGKDRGPFPPEDDEKAWIQATDKWEIHQGDYKPAPGTTRILLMFKIKGNVDIDAVSFKAK